MKKNSKLIWIDIKNSHEPLLFKSLMKDLPYKFYITARDYAEIIGLLKKYNINHTVIGKYHATTKYGKILNLVVRSLELAIKIPRYDYFLSHGSIYGIVASKLRMKKRITITDNDFYNRTNKIIYENSDFLIVPSALNHKKFKTKKVYQFDGFKEDIYIGDFNPKKCKREIPFENYVLIRPEAYKAYYLDHKVKTIVPELISKFQEKNINIVLLPRYPEERELYKKHTNVYIPRNPIHGLCGAWFADAVLTGSGTLGREAACMGVPAVSFFPGRKLLSVDEVMVKRGWLYHSRDAEKIVKYVLNITPQKRGTERSKKVRKDVISIIREIVE